jgi:hypothetical protein
VTEFVQVEMFRSVECLLVTGGSRRGVIVVGETADGVPFEVWEAEWFVRQAELKVGDRLETWNKVGSM